MIRIYFEKGPMQSILELEQEITTDFYFAKNICGYRTLINDIRQAATSKRDIYTNDLSVIGASELWGDQFLVELYLRNENNKWYKVNPYLLRKLKSPIEIEDYLRRHLL